MLGLSYAFVFKVKKEPWRERAREDNLAYQSAKCLLEFTALLQGKGYNLKLENNLSKIPFLFRQLMILKMSHQRSYNTHLKCRVVFPFFFPGDKHLTFRK